MRLTMLGLRMDYETDERRPRKDRKMDKRKNVAETKPFLEDARFLAGLDRDVANRCHCSPALRAVGGARRSWCVARTGRERR